MTDYELLTLQLRQMISKANLVGKFSEKDTLRFIETLHEIDQKLKDNQGQLTMNNNDFQIIQTSKKGVNIFWWVFWLIVFWPFLAFVVIVHFGSETIYHVQYRNNQGKMVVDKMTEKEYSRFVSMM